MTVDNAADQVIGRLAIPPAHPAAIAFVHADDEAGLRGRRLAFFTEGPIALGEFQERAEARAGFVVDGLTPR